MIAHMQFRFLFPIIAISIFANGSSAIPPQYERRFELAITNFKSSLTPSGKDELQKLESSSLSELEKKQVVGINHTFLEEEPKFLDLQCVYNRKVDGSGESKLIYVSDKAKAFATVNEKFFWKLIGRVYYEFSPDRDDKNNLTVLGIREATTRAKKLVIIEPQKEPSEWFDDSEKPTSGSADIPPKGYREVDFNDLTEMHSAG